MTTSEFFAKFKSRYLWGNLLAMLAVVVVLGLAVRYGIDLYTHHGESIEIPNLKNKKFADAQHLVENLNLQIVVSDTGYVKTLPPDCILSQSPEPGEHVKSGHIIYVTVNASQTPTLALPDVIDNSSLREAMAKLSAMGFLLGMPQYVPGERDWVMGIRVNGHNMSVGDRVSVEDSVIIVVGNGQRDAADSVDYVDPVYPEVEEQSEEDEFEEVVTPPTGE